MQDGSSFDFASHLYHQTGIYWEVEKLIGGSANYTVRARRLANEHDRATKKSGTYPSVLKPHTSVVLKQAPAFLAKSPEIPFSTYRQTVEAAALRMFHQRDSNHPSALDNLLKDNRNIMIPRLLLHDPTYDILIQSDLGALPSLYEVIISLDTSPGLASELGKTLGKFLANLHDAFNPTSSLVSVFKNDYADRVMAAVIDRATTYMKDAGVSDYGTLGKRALDHWNNRTKSAFSQGDIWFGTLLVDLRSQTSSNTGGLTATIGICDWEFAGPNHPAADIAQLGSYLHLLSLSPSITPQTKDVVMEISTSLYKTYYKDSLTPVTNEYRRSLVIMHAWEMINAACWESRQHMWCTCIGGNSVKCSHIKKMVTIGANLLRAAGPATSMDVQALRNISWCRFFPISLT